MIIFKIQQFFLIFLISSVCYSQWYQLPGSPYHPGRFDDIYFVNEYTGWVINFDNAHVYRTNNGGMNWILADSIKFSASLRAVTAVNENLLFIGTLDTSKFLLKSTDGGFNWQIVDNVPSPKPRGICGLWTLNSQYIFGCGKYNGNPTFIKSTDAGNTWTSKDMSSYISALVDCYFFSNKKGIVVGGTGNLSQSKSRVLLTNDGGESWVNVYTGDRLFEWCWKISFPDSNNGFISLERISNPNKYFIKTSNGGLSWTELPFVNQNEQGIGFINENTGWIGGNFNPTYYTSNGGVNWIGTTIGENINRFRFVNDSIGYACGRYVYKYSKTVGISQISFELPSLYKLYQNFPNPFNPSTIIKFDVKKSSFVDISIFDITGKKVQTLVSEFKHPGTYQTGFNSMNSRSKLSGGIYFCKLVAGGNSMTNVMILLK